MKMRESYISRQANSNIVLSTLFVWLISHQPAVLFSVLFSQKKPTPAISHQPNEQAKMGY
jgi:hypothetical protein